MIEEWKLVSMFSYGRAFSRPRRNPDSIGFCVTILPATPSSNNEID